MVRKNKRQSNFDKPVVSIYRRISSTVTTRLSMRPTFSSVNFTVKRQGRTKNNAACLVFQSRYYHVLSSRGLALVQFWKELKFACIGHSVVTGTSPKDCTAESSTVSLTVSVDVKHHMFTYFALLAHFLADLCVPSYWTTAFISVKIILDLPCSKPHNGQKPLS